MTTSGLRERKKQATRRHLADVAKELFAARGFDNVTVAEVAQAANVSKMTVFNYFPRKEDLFLDRHADQLRDVERALAGRAPGESVTTALRRYQHQLLDAHHELSGAVEGIAGCWEIISASPALLSRLHEQALELQAVISEVLARETGDPLMSRLAAGQLAAAVGAIFETALRRMVDGEDIDRVRRDQAALVDAAFDLLEHGLGNFGAR
ncbi:MAG TPA: TetR family transcriptional regulator [Nocardioidaceae bacterium]|nr:TetR family transcriptional regulator [Nocardioidaceae bacterium]